MHRSRNTQSNRPALTLVELMVTMGIIALLATIGVMLMPNTQYQRVVAGADQLQNQLLVARSRALSEQGFRGIRLTQQVPVAGKPTVVMLEFIERPDPIVYSTGVISLPGTPQSAVASLPPGTPRPPLPYPAAQTAGYVVHAVMMMTATGTPLSFGGLVSAGDVLEVGSALTSYTIVGAGVGSLLYEFLFVEYPPTAIPSTHTTANFRIVRKNRPIAGETPIALPDNLMIDDITVGNATAPGRSRLVRERGDWDILFAPSGQVVGSNASLGKLVFWLRDATSVTVTGKEGDQRLIGVYTKTGLTASHPIAIGADPFKFLNDGQGSGL